MTNNVQIEFMISIMKPKQKIQGKTFSLGSFQFSCSTVENNFFKIILTLYSLLWDFTTDTIQNELLLQCLSIEFTLSF